MTAITFKRTGADHEIQSSFELDGLPAADAQDLRRLIEAARFFSLPESLGTAGMLDEPQYVVTIESDGRQRTVSVNDGAVPPALRPLLEALSRLAEDTRA